MAVQSTLAIEYNDITRAVATFAGWDRTEGNWETEQAADFLVILKRGLRRFYYPPTPQGVPPYEWTFMRLRAESAATTTSNAVSYIDLSEADLPGFNGIIQADSMTFEINAGDDDMRQLKRVANAEIRALISKTLNSANTGLPRYWSIEAQAPTYAADQQTWRLWLFPEPNQSYVLSFLYPHTPNLPTTTNKYPVGGDAHGETMLEAILSVAEEVLDDDPEGVHYRRFMELLQTSIRLDQGVSRDEEPPK